MNGSREWQAPWVPVPHSAHSMEGVWDVCEASRVWGTEGRNQLGHSGHQERLRQGSLENWLWSAWVVEADWPLRGGYIGWALDRFDKG